MVADHETTLARSDVVQPSDCSVRLHFRMVDRNPVDLVLRPDDRNDFGFGVELLDMRQHLGALDLDRIAQVVERLSGPDGALVLASLNRRSGYGVGSPAQVLVVDASRLLDGLRGQRHHFNLAVGGLGVSPDLQLAAEPLDDHAIWPVHLFPESFKVLDAALFHNHLVRVEQEKCLARALVEVFLNVANSANHAVWQPIAPSPITPNRSQRELVVPERRLGPGKNTELGEHAHVNAHHHPRRGFQRTRIRVGQILFSHDVAAESRVSHNPYRNRLSILRFDQLDPAPSGFYQGANPRAAHDAYGAGVENLLAEIPRLLFVFISVAIDAQPFD